MHSGGRKEHGALFYSQELPALLTEVINNPAAVKEGRLGQVGREIHFYYSPLQTSK